MNGINLIPASRLAARRRAARVRLWLSIAPLCISALAGSYGYLFASWDTDRTELEVILGETEAAISKSQRDVAERRSRLVEVRARLRASAAVSNQPDWGLLLEILAARLGDNAVLTSCTLEPAVRSQPAESAKPGAIASAPAEAPPRPDRYRLVLSGVARTQEVVPEFLRRLEETGLFEAAKLIESTRTPFAGAEAFRFQVECTMADCPLEAP